MCTEPSSLVDGTLLKALARAHRWQGILEGGEYGSIEELARAERINPSYLARVLRLVLLAPDIVESILDGRHGPGEDHARKAYEAVPGDVGRAATEFVISNGLTSGTYQYLSAVRGTSLD
jgi:hypothetical protein